MCLYRSHLPAGLLSAVCLWSVHCDVNDTPLQRRNHHRETDESQLNGKCPPGSELETYLIRCPKNSYGHKYIKCVFLQAPYCGHSCVGPGLIFH